MRSADRFADKLEGEADRREALGHEAAAAGLRLRARQVRDAADELRGSRSVRVVGMGYAEDRGRRAVAPENVHVRPVDLHWSERLTGPPIGGVYHVTVIHEPTGLSAEASARSRLEAKEIALGGLRAKLAARARVREPAG